jgi:hypothetical protein
MNIHFQIRGKDVPCRVAFKQICDERTIDGVKGNRAIAKISIIGNFA